MAEKSIHEQKCKACGEIKPLASFYTRVRPPGKLQVLQPCKPCHIRSSVELARRRRVTHPTPKRTVYCACGCGEEVARININFKLGHQTTKRCKRCGAIRSIEDFAFGAARVRANGVIARYRDPWCKPCRYERDRNDPITRAKKAAYQRKFSKTEHGRKLKRENRQLHLDTHRAASVRWVSMNREKRRMTLRISQQARRIAGGWSKNSKAVRKAIEETLELARIGNQYLDAYTGELIDEPTIDHIIPISKGGTNDADNLCVTSLSNNSSKFNDSLLIWLIKRRRNV